MSQFWAEQIMVMMAGLLPDAEVQLITTSISSALLTCSACDVIVWQSHQCFHAAGLLLISEFWAGEITVMMAGLLPDAEVQLAAMAIFQTTNDLCFMVPLGLSAAVSTRYAQLPMFNFVNQ